MIMANIQNIIVKFVKIFAYLFNVWVEADIME